jgi:hypothetical protein
MLSPGPSPPPGLSPPGFGLLDDEGTIISFISIGGIPLTQIGKVVDIKVVVGA